ncbi:hypothetical protein E2C01_076634 [Portunus trituberculatus]|uniref:Uncharacterized protein n=1 Tax=Portunus trituberculatus TaxID=210409 RepID=A0A5B7IDP8_PORTR|nr:hypothetical protein [Portunus trituberculatus]
MWLPSLNSNCQVCNLVVHGQPTAKSKFHQAEIHQEAEQLEKIRKGLKQEVDFHKKQIKAHEEALKRHKERLDELD